MWESDHKESCTPKNWCFQTMVLEKTLESPLDSKESNQSVLRKTALNNHWKDWCWIWSSNALATRCEEPTRWKSLWCWERLRAGGEGDSRGRDGWMASLIQWTWIWGSSGRWWSRAAWYAAVGGVAKNQTWLSNWTTIKSKIYITCNSTNSMSQYTL